MTDRRFDRPPPQHVLTTHCAVARAGTVSQRTAQRSTDHLLSLYPSVPAPMTGRRLERPSPQHVPTTQCAVARCHRQTAVWSRRPTNYSCVSSRIPPTRHSPCFSISSHRPRGVRANPNLGCSTHATSQSAPQIIKGGSAPSTPEITLSKDAGPCLQTCMQST